MRKKILTTVFLTSFVMGDFIGGEFNLGYYNHSPSGTATYDDDEADIENELKWSDEGDLFLKAYLEHPFPLIPNVKVGYTAFSHSGSGRVTAFSWGNIINVTDKIDSDLDLNLYDFALYYEVLDNWVNLDVGLNVRYVDGAIAVDTTTEHEYVEFDVPIPMLYGKARFDVPLSDVSFQMEGNYITYDDNTLYDLEIGARYIFKLGLGVEMGYKLFKLELDDVDDLSLDADFDGIYGKLVWDF